MENPRPSQAKPPWDPAKYPNFVWDPESESNEPDAQGRVKAQIFINLGPSGRLRQFAHLFQEKPLPRPPSVPKVRRWRLLVWLLTKHILEALLR